MYADSIHCHTVPIFSQVSRAWRVLAEDGVLWFRMCIREGYHPDASVSDSPCWKSTLRDCRNSAKTVCSNWKVGSGCAPERLYSTTQIQHLHWSLSVKIGADISVECTVDHELYVSYL